MPQTPQRSVAQGAESSDALGRRHRRIAVYAGLFAVFMLGMAFAAVPLYRVFCQTTGFGGTPQRVATPSDTVSDMVVTVRFDGNVAHGLPWRFEPVQHTVQVHLGENTLAYYRATNLSDRTTTGTASFNVAPEAAGQHFAKVACFCFTEQTLAAGESVEMPVSFYVDPGYAEDSAARGVSQITLSYTFYPSAGGETQAKERKDQAGAARALPDQRT